MQGKCTLFCNLLFFIIHPLCTFCTQVAFSKSEELFHSTLVHGGIFIIAADAAVPGSIVYTNPVSGVYTYVGI
jgi:hypothetical protein